jgi:hypothetical protein
VRTGRTRWWVRLRFRAYDWAEWLTRPLPGRARCWLNIEHDFVGVVSPGYFYADQAFCRRCGEEQGG